MSDTSNPLNLSHPADFASEGMSWLERFTPPARHLAAVIACVALLPSPAPADVETLPDREITQAIETQFKIQKGVPFDRIEVETQDGVVTLTGVVFHVLAKERASEIAGAVRGVVGVVNRISVEPPERTDASIKDDISRVFYRNPATEGRGLRATVRDGQVILVGTVESSREKEIAGLLAKGIMGVESVANDIEVVPVQARSAVEIQEEIEETLRWDARVDDALIAVHVDDEGKVALAGFVGSVAEKARAMELARVAGVTGVTATDLTVDPRMEREKLRVGKFPPRADSEIHAAVERVFQQDPRVRPFHPEVSVKDGIVTLRGSVNQLDAKRIAEEDARSVAGVWHVRNLLKVKPGDPVPDEETAENVREAIRLDPFVQRRQIDVTVHDGEVRLEGTVGSKFEKKRAESAASAAAGVVAIHNDLRVPNGEEFGWKSDWTIKHDIQQELEWSPFVDADDVRVEVDDGAATLTGTVDTWMEWRSAKENALEGGATEVHNELDVRYGPEDRQASSDE